MVACSKLKHVAELYLKNVYVYVLFAGCNCFIGTIMQ
jgi:hypothetical protein